jgi:hypothetical protein
MKIDSSKAINSLVYIKAETRGQKSMIKPVMVSNCAKTSAITFKDSISSRNLSFASESKSGSALNQQIVPINYLQISDCSGCTSLGFKAVT